MHYHVVFFCQNQILQIIHFEKYCFTEFKIELAGIYCLPLMCLRCLVLQYYADANEAESWIKEKLPLVQSEDYGKDEATAKVGHSQPITSGSTCYRSLRHETRHHFDLLLCKSY